MLLAWRWKAAQPNKRQREFSLFDFHCKARKLKKFLKWKKKKERRKCPLDSNRWMSEEEKSSFFSTFRFQVSECVCGCSRISTHLTSPSTHLSPHPNTQIFYFFFSSSPRSSFFLHSRKNFSIFTRGSWRELNVWWWRGRTRCFEGVRCRATAANIRCWVTQNSKQSEDKVGEKLKAPLFGVQHIDRFFDLSAKCVPRRQSITTFRQSNEQERTLKWFMVAWCNRGERGGEGVRKTRRVFVKSSRKEA